MMTLHARPIDPQLPLSLLFLAVAEGARQEIQRYRAAEAEREEAYEFERAMEEPERWDGLL